MRESRPFAAGVLHGAGYTGGELVRMLLMHPRVELQVVTSRSFAERALWEAHPSLRGWTDLTFSNADTDELSELDVLFLAAEHGAAASIVRGLREAGYAGAVVDLSADFRLRDPELYPKWYGREHPAPHLLAQFQYGLPEVYGPYRTDSRLIANPGCFATGVTLALWPFRRARVPFRSAVTALTGASGSGTRASSVTHFPTREGNVRAYKVLSHQHLAEIRQTLGPTAEIGFVPVSGPWTRGIWGTAHVEPSDRVTATDVAAMFEDAYRDAPMIRLWPDQLPEMRFSVGTPFCDLGWIVKDDSIVVGFALDNLLKGAASQALQNMNLVLGLPETLGVLPSVPAVPVQPYQL